MNNVFIYTNLKPNILQFRNQSPYLKASYSDKKKLDTKLFSESVNFKNSK